MKHIKSKYILILCVLSSVVLFSSPAIAAEISVNSGSKGSVGVPSQFQVSVILNTQGDAINAVRGKVSFPPSLLGIREIEDGNSIINLWIQQPALGSDGEISFSGITTSGYKGESGVLFSVVFQTKGVGTGSISVDSAQALINDGNGTAAQVSVSPLQISVEGGTSSSSTTMPVNTVLPDVFSPEISRSPDIFGNKWFVSFVAQDKGPGIDHYEIMETRDPLFKAFSTWVVAKSPYVLSDQSLKSYIFIKAIDKAGNSRIVELQPTNPLAWYENHSYWLILLIGVSILATVYSILRRVVWKKQKKESV